MDSYHLEEVMIFIYAKNITNNVIGVIKYFYHIVKNSLWLDAEKRIHGEPKLLEKI